jgi:hypothetical protein
VLLGLALKYSRYVTRWWRDAKNKKRDAALLKAGLDEGLLSLYRPHALLYGESL